jgi:hypothetical protein
MHFYERTFNSSCMVGTHFTAWSIDTHGRTVSAKVMMVTHRTIMGCPPGTGVALEVSSATDGSPLVRGFACPGLARASHAPQREMRLTRRRPRTPGASRLTHQGAALGSCRRLASSPRWHQGVSCTCIPMFLWASTRAARGMKNARNVYLT